MSRISRIPPFGPAVFLTASLSDPGSDLLLREADALRWAAAMTLQEHPVDVLAWVTLPAVFQTIWRLPPEDGDPVVRLSMIQHLFSRSLAEGRQGGLWRQGAAQVLQGPKDLAEHLELCRLAPVAEGLVARAEEWPLSSFSTGFQSRRVG